MIKEFAEYFSLTVWDWMAFIIAVSSLFVALFSYVVALRTLKSQKQTEKNTMPIVNMQIQELLLNQLMTETFWGRIKLMALWLSVIGEEYAKPSKHILKSIELHRDYIHCELFYTDSIKYKEMNRLLKRVDEYNMYLAVLNDYLTGSRIDKKILDHLFCQMGDLIEMIILSWMNTMLTIRFSDPVNLNGWLLQTMSEIEADIDFYNRLANIAEEEDKTQTEEGTSEDSIYRNSSAGIHAEKFILFAQSDKELEKKILSFMTQHTNIYRRIYQQYLISKNSLRNKTSHDNRKK